MPSEVHAARGERLASLDILRGLVMVVMVLDHARDYFAPAGFPPEDLSQTTPAWFLTRWITHFCAPVFVFLAGTSIYLRQFGQAPDPASAPRTAGRPGMSRYVLTRGLWLILLELTVIGLCWGFLLAGVFTLQVIWALGVSMLVMAVLVRCPWQVSLIFGAMVVGLHNLLDRVTAIEVASRGFPELSTLWMVLHEPGFVSLRPDATEPFTLPGVMIIYPLLPWIGVMPLGYAFGRIAAAPARIRDRWCLALGGAAVAAFLLLRLAGWYGDPAPYALHRDRWPILSVLATTKYPASLQFLLMTLGPALLLLPGLGRLGFAGAAGRAAAGVLETFGRVPLFFYLLHIPLLHAASLALWFGMYGVISGWQLDRATWPPGYHPQLWVAYAAWLLTLLVLYRPCRWFAAVRRRRRDWWLSYL